MSEANPKAGRVRSYFQVTSLTSGLFPLPGVWWGSS